MTLTKPFRSNPPTQKATIWGDCVSSSSTDWRTRSRILTRPFSWEAPIQGFTQESDRPIGFWKIMKRGCIIWMNRSKNHQETMPFYPKEAIFTSTLSSIKKQSMIWPWLWWKNQRIREFITKEDWLIIKTRNTWSASKTCSSPMNVCLPQTSKTTYTTISGSRSQIWATMRRLLTRFQKRSA